MNPSPPLSSLSRRKRIVFAAVLGLATLCVCLALLEVGARGYGGYRVFAWRLIHPADESTGRAFFEPNKFKIWNENWIAQHPEEYENWPVELETFAAPDVYPHYLFYPGLRITRDKNTLRPAKPGESIHWSSNAHGMRGENVRTKANQVRIVCLGASTTEGSHDDATTYPVYLQSDLRTRYPNLDIEVVNGGHHAYNSGDCVAFLERIIVDLDPDIVIWYQGANDMYWPNWLRNPPKSTQSGALRRMQRYSAVLRALFE